MKKHGYFFIALLGFLLLSACTKQPTCPITRLPNTNIVVQSSCAFALADNPRLTQQVLTADLINRLMQYPGVEVVQMGETLRVILGDNQLFTPNSANLRAVHVVPLDILARLMLILETTSVEVAGYTNIERTAHLNKVLAERQAQVVADYLWAKGLNSRLIYAVGYGNTEAIMANVYDRKNQRVEVRFQYIPYGIGR